MTCLDCGQPTLSKGVCIDCSNKRFNDYPRLKKTVDELTEIYPKIITIVNGWQRLAELHGISLTEKQHRDLRKYVRILENLGVLKNDGS